MSAKLPDNKSRATMAAEKFGKLDDGTQLRNKQTAARRTAKALMTVLAEFSDFLSVDERDALSMAQAALRRLGNDFEVGARIARKASDERIAKYQREEAEEKDRKAAAYFGSASLEVVLCACEDMAAFELREGHDWFQAKHPGERTYVGLNSAYPNSALAAYRAEPTAERLTALRRSFVTALDDMRWGGLSSYRIWSPRVADFEEFRRYRSAKRLSGAAA